MDHKNFLKSLSAAEKAQFNERSDWRGLRHLFLHCVLLACGGTWIFLSLPFWQVVLIPHGILLAFLFTLQHECTHNTPFKSIWLNTLFGHMTAIILGQPFLWFRYFHFAHHKYTNIAGKDPELEGPAKPETWGQMVRHISCLDYYWAKLTTLFNSAFGRLDAAYIPQRKRTHIRLEAIFLIILYTLIGISGATMLIWLWLIPLLFGFPVLRLYLLAEHGGSKQVANMFINSRTTITSRIVRFVAWNMPYHAEHHAMPSVPFHQLPKVHVLTRPHLGVITNGYWQFSRDYTEHFDR